MLIMVLPTGNSWQTQLGSANSFIQMSSRYSANPIGVSVSLSVLSACVVPFRAPNLTTSVDPMLTWLYNLDNGPKQFNGRIPVVVAVVLVPTVVVVFVIIVVAVVAVAVVVFWCARKKRVEQVLRHVTPYYARPTSQPGLPLLLLLAMSKSTSASASESKSSTPELVPRNVFAICLRKQQHQQQHLQQQQREQRLVATR